MKLEEALKSEAFIVLVINECRAFGEHEMEDMFDLYLDEINGTVKIGQLEYLSSHVLKRVDPVAYNCGVADFIDSKLSDEEFVEIAGDYYRHDDVYHLFEKANTKTSKDPSKKAS